MYVAETTVVGTNSFVCITTLRLSLWFSSPFCFKLVSVDGKKTPGFSPSNFGGLLRDGTEMTIRHHTIESNNNNNNINL